MSDKPVPMEVEEVGMDDYMLDFQGMLDRLDSPSEIHGEGVGDCAGDDSVVREESLMSLAGRGGTLGPSVPCGVRFSQWVEAHRESCNSGT